MKKEINIFADISTIDDKALEQFHSAMEQDAAVKGALLPDAHVGYTLPIGGVIATEGMVYPSWVGYDIGCGMCALLTPFKGEEVRANRDDIYNRIYRDIPTGVGGYYKEDILWDKKDKLDRTELVKNLMEKGAKKGALGVRAPGTRQIGTLGGGNHFIEIGIDDKKGIWIIVHSGSRGFGYGVAENYMARAAKSEKAKEGHFGFRTDSAEGKEYIKDMNYCLEYALENRKQMILKVYNIMKYVLGKEHKEYLLHDWDPHRDSDLMEGEFINRNHNHAVEKDGLWIHRKGATHAELGMYGVIPGNMRDGSFIVRGKGNPESLYSSSHGAGRALGRRKAHRVLSLDEFKETMKKEDVKANVTSRTLDEAPMAYKNIFEVMEYQKDLVDVITHVRPIINIKG